MNLQNLRLLHAYESGKNNLIGEFYIPTLCCAKRYDRIAGFFSSTCLAIASRGIAGLIQNGGKMRLITCQRLNPADVKMLEASVTDVESILTKNFITDFEQIEDQFKHDHIEALGWMIANKYLEIKIALVYNKGRICTSDEIDNQAIMHQKVGIIYDDDLNAISFSGSNNESASGWLDNIEEFKVFKEWEVGQSNYFKNDQQKFNSFWNNERKDVKVVNMPQAIHDKLIEMSCDFRPEKIAMERYFSGIKEKNTKEELKLFFYQKSAVELWYANNFRLMLEMATGCGKTRTAIGCIKKMLEGSGTYLIIISCPQNTLSTQWAKDINSLDIQIDKCIIADGTVQGWNIKLSMVINQLVVGLYKSVIVYTTHQTCSSTKFTNLFSNVSNQIEILFIGDEAHGLGAPKRQKGLLERYNYRLGLSATPQRWFDDIGSDTIYNYFGGKSFEFTMEDALNTINPYTGKTFLVNFYYRPFFINLTEDELTEYKALSDKIKKISYRKNDSGRFRKTLEFLRFKRADLEKNAKNKYITLEKVLDEINDDIQDTIIFVSDNQIEQVMKMLSRRYIRAHKFTKDEGTTPSAKFGGVSERDYLINKFKQKDYQVLVAIKCLDEGIDIPSAKRAIIMASSTNPREYIQRIGRIIRQDSQKFQANIFDLIIRPELSGFVDEQFIELEERIFRKEMERVKELSKNALNNSIVSKQIFDILREMK